MNRRKNFQIKKRRNFLSRPVVCTGQEMKGNLWNGAEKAREEWTGLNVPYSTQNAKYKVR